MATFEKVNIGSAPNAKDGDPARVAFNKINNNFEVLFEASGTVIEERPQDFVAEGGRTYLINTITKSLTAKLPQAPAVGTIIRFVDTGGNLAVNHFYIDPNGSRIQGQAVPGMEYSDNFMFVDFFYTGSISGWIVR